MVPSTPILIVWMVSFGAWNTNDICANEKSGADRAYTGFTTQLASGTKVTVSPSCHVSLIYQPFTMADCNSFAEYGAAESVTDSPVLYNPVPSIIYEFEFCSAITE